MKHEMEIATGPTRKGYENWEHARHVWQERAMQEGTTPDIERIIANAEKHLAQRQAEPREEADRLEKSA